MVILTTDYQERKPSKVTGVTVTASEITWKAVADKEHCYYRVYEDGKQIASTVAVSLPYAVKAGSKYTVKSVDAYGNIG